MYHPAAPSDAAGIPPEENVYRGAARSCITITAVEDKCAWETGEAVFVKSSLLFPASRLYDSILLLSNIPTKYSNL